MGRVTAGAVIDTSDDREVTVPAVVARAHRS
ncbi:hypothetical protein HNR49_000533 [Halobacterium salinarum]|uniref:Uncharacterized protein n=3 Tax=Halobacterium salinarum TaxID=2242 RepID=A0A510N8F2_HALSA|nr:hypothetical protein [Halobacterium salinarum]QCC45667.1 uncharacterized protein HBSAL_10120 [Halobacterium salinarum]DAC78924.1 TPA_inf: uncharacterized protein VNG_2014a [Halobacterium salinarum NRC-1]